MVLQGLIQSAGWVLKQFNSYTSEQAIILLIACSAYILQAIIPYY